MIEHMKGLDVCTETGTELSRSFKDNSILLFNRSIEWVRT
jgi:hypothetical protein